MVEEAFSKFGRSAFGDGLLYSDPTAIRFELAVGRTRIERFDSALARSWTVISDLFNGRSEIGICLSYYGRSFLSVLSYFRDLHDCEVSIPSDYYTDQEQPEDDDNLSLTRIFFEAELDTVYRLLWAKVARELGIEPSLPFGLYIFDLSLGVLVHPYDDRGMDVLGPNQDTLKLTYSEHNEWLLDYDMELMQQRYGAD